MTELKDYEKDVLEAIRTSRDNGDTTITIKIHFNDKEADKISKSVTEIEDRLKSTLDELSTHAQDIEEEADTRDCECDNCEDDQQMEFEEHDSWPDTYDEMLTDIYEHFDDQLTDIQAEVAEIHHNVDLMTKAIPESFDILEERLGVAPSSKVKKKDIKYLTNLIIDIRHKLDDLKDFALDEKQCNEDYNSISNVSGEIDKVYRRVNDVYEAVFDSIDHQKAMDAKLDKILALLQPKTSAKKPTTKKPAAKSDSNE